MGEEESEAQGNDCEENSHSIPRLFISPRPPFYLSAARLILAQFCRHDFQAAQLHPKGTADGS